MKKHSSGKTKKILKLVFSFENLLALLIAFLLIALFIATADSSPLWVYQGF